MRLQQTPSLQYQQYRVLTEEQCDEIVAACVPRLEVATVARAGKRVVDLKMRNALLAEPDDIPELTPLLARVRVLLGHITETPVANQERFQFSRYEENGHFVWHGDGKLRRHSCVIYLNSEFRGGNTTFSRGPSITPEMGHLLTWENTPHEWKHKAEPVTSGHKDVLLTWIRDEPIDRSKPTPSPNPPC